MLLPIVLLHGKERNPWGKLTSAVQFKRWSKSVGKKCLEFLRMLLKACPKMLMMILIFATTSYFTKAKSSENGYLFEFDWEREGGGR